MRLQEAKRDLYRKLAKEQGYRSRAAFKLIEANRKYGFIRRGYRVVDFGAAPGGWMQVASELVGPGGLVVGVDLHHVNLKKENAVAIEIDVNDPGASSRLLALLGGPADVVLSDLSPTVSGVWELDQTRQVDLTLRVLDLSATVLRRGGSAFLKLFEGERSQEVRDALKERFRTVRPIKPAATRSSSSELYYYCEGWSGNEPVNARKPAGVPLTRGLHP
jgi:23S rRNA (uridine2552-2'-O)-methyltransferase